MGNPRLANRRLPIRTRPASTPKPSSPNPAVVSVPPVAVAVVPSPVAGAPPGLTVSVLLAVTPLEQSMSGWYEPALMLDGSTTVVTNSLLCVLTCMGMCSGRPSVVPMRVADEAGPAAVSELQFTANVVGAPAVEGLGVISTGAELA